MESGSKKHKGSRQCIGERDRLSELPDEVLLHILSYLPTLDAVRTVLLRRFGNLWTLVPSLNFNEDDLVETYGFKDSEWENETVHKAMFSCFSVFVNIVLILHKRSTIKKFNLELRPWWDDKYEEAAEKGFEVWMRFVLDRKAKELMLKCNHIPLPGFIFTSRFLVRLKLEGCNIKLPRRVDMRSLKSLTLVGVDMWQEDFDEFVSRCNCLQELVLKNNNDLDALNFSNPTIEKLGLQDDLHDGYCEPMITRINCPNLKILDFLGIIPGVEVFDVPSVREVTIDADYTKFVNEEEARGYKRILEWFRYAEVVTVSREACRKLTSFPELNAGYPQNRWKLVVLKGLIQDIGVAGICGLIRHSPDLEELIIHVYQDTEILSTGAELKNDNHLVSQEASTPCVAPHLKVVSVHGMHNEVPLQLLEFLLKCAVNLDKFVIFPNRRSQLTLTKELQILNFPRVSTKAKIVFK